MSMFNSLSYAIKLVNAGVPREQAEVHAQVLQGVYEQEHEQYATRTDFIILSNQVRVQTDQLTELKTSVEQCKNEIAECKNEFVNFRSDILMLKNSHKYLLWIGGVVATMCLSVFGLSVSTIISR